MLRKLALSLAVASALGTSQANALGLGEIKVNSALNEPLQAEIQLLETRDLTPLQIQPRMADLDQFSVAGITKPRFLSDVEFQVELNPNGGGTIYLTSDQAVKEPFLSFLVELNWPNGRLVREYTLLLDPPVYDAAPVQSQLTAARAQTRPLAPATPVPARARDDIRSRMDSSSQIYVDVRDVLWTLAEENRPQGVTVPQMMLALQRKNPQAFPTSNINHLKAGVVMDLPSREEIEALSAAQARREMNRQTEAWRQRGKGAPAQAQEPVKTPLEGSAPKSDAQPQDQAPESEPQGELKIISPETRDETDSDESVDASDKEDQGAASDQTAQESAQREQELIAENEALENRLAVTLETVDKIERDNAELNSKLDAIQEQMDTLQRLLELKDQQMASLQEELAQSQEQARLAEEKANQGIISKLMETLSQVPGYAYGAGAGVLALLLGLLAWLKRRNKDEESDEQESGSGSDMIRMPEETAPLMDEPEEVPDKAPEEAAAEPEQQTKAEPEDTLDDLDDLSDLDLDMDLDLDESLEADAKPEQAEQGATDDLDEAFDLGIDDLDDLSEADAKPAATEEDFDDALDDILGGDEPESAGLDPVAGLPEEDDLPDDTLESLGLDEGPEDEPEKDQVTSPVTSQDDELEFGLDELSGPEADAQAQEEQAADEDLDFALNEPQGEEEQDDLDALLEDDDQALDFTSQSEDKPAAAQDLNDTDDLDALLAENAPAQASEEAAAPAKDDNTQDDLDALLEESSAPASEETDTSDSSDEEDDFDIDSLFEEPDEPAQTDTDQPQASSQTEDEDVEMHPDLEALLAEGQADDAAGAEESKGAERELSDNIAHDLEMDLDSELDDMLSGTDDDVALDETSAEDDDLMGGLDLLEGADEVETKLDLARAYIDMDDTEGARDILNEIVAEGSEAQQAEAQKLLQSLS